MNSLSKCPWVVIILFSTLIFDIVKEFEANALKLRQRQVLVQENGDRNVVPQMPDEVFSENDYSPHQTPPRLDRRNVLGDIPPFSRQRPRCTKRIRIANGITRFRDRGSFVRYACSDGFMLLGPTISVCLRSEWSEPPPICVRPGCRRILTPANGVATLLYAGALVSFSCQNHYLLEGSPSLYCDGSRWNGTEPVCLPLHVTTTTTEEAWEWLDTTTEESSPEIHTEQYSNNELWDTNTPVTTLEPVTNSSSIVPLPQTSPSSSNTSFYEISSKPTTASSRGIQVSSQTPLDASSSTVNSETTVPNINSTPTTTTLVLNGSSVSTKLPILLTSATPLMKIPEDNTIVTTLYTEKRPITTTTTTRITTSSESHRKETTSRKETYPVPPGWPPKPEIETTTKAFVTSLSPEIIQPFVPISPDKLDNHPDTSADHYKNISRVSTIGGIILGTLGTISLICGIATYCWRKNVGIARPTSHDIDGRTLSASDANDDFMWMDSRDHPDSRSRRQ